MYPAKLGFVRVARSLERQTDKFALVPALTRRGVDTNREADVVGGVFAYSAHCGRGSGERVDLNKMWAAALICALILLGALAFMPGMRSPLTTYQANGQPKSQSMSEARATATPEQERLADGDLSGLSLQRLETLADAGSSDAALLLGLRYAGGPQEQRDEAQAVRWFEVAALAGSAQAQFNLALMLTNGRGTERNLSEAARWYKLAAAQGLASAQFNLANMLANGRGLARDDAAAAHWYEQAATQGIAEAEFNLGKMYQGGRGVVKSEARARLAFRRAYDLGLTVALDELESLGVAARVQPELMLRASVEADPLQRAVLGLDERRFTVQLVSYATREKAVAFVEKYDLGEIVGVYRSWKRGGYFYSVVAGEYSTYGAAREAGLKLAQRLGLNGLEPWARAVARVQTEALEQAPRSP